jgi:diguanylate cyclase (GGDEF)-like protein
VRLTPNDDPSPTPPAGEGRPRAGRLLVVDDDVPLLNALCEALRGRGFEVAAFSDPADALAALRERPFDLLLTDLMMPGTDGIAVLRLAHEICPGLVGVMMTGHGSIQLAVEAMRAGAVDFVLKPFRMRHALPVIDRALGVGRMRAENERLRREVERLEAERVRPLEDANARLAALATTDPLTGLANRRALEEAAARESALGARIGRPLSLILLDADHFKAFNDAFGHPAGDEVRRQVGAAVRACCRATDLPARIGGEEFAILLPATDAAGGRVLAERVRAAVEAGSWPQRPVTISVGVATCEWGSAEALIAAADRALYEAKRAGRNRVVADGPAGG